MTTLTMPTSPNFASSRFGLQSNTVATMSPLTRTVQTQAFGGDRWTGLYQLPPMLRATAASWIAFLTALQGRSGRFYGFDPDCKTPRGTWGGTPLVNGGSQTGTALICDGFSASATVKAGDYFSVNSELKMVTADGTADGSGNLTISFTPSLRSSPSDDAAITKTSATCTMMLVDDDQAAWDADAVGVFGLSFSGVEVFV